MWSQMYNLVILFCFLCLVCLTLFFKRHRVVPQRQTHQLTQYKSSQHHSLCDLAVLNFQLLLNLTKDQKLLFLSSLSPEDVQRACSLFVTEAYHSSSYQTLHYTKQYLEKLGAKVTTDEIQPRLPLALWFEILQFFDVATRASLASVSRAWHHVVADPRCWRSFDMDFHSNQSLYSADEILTSQSSFGKWEYLQTLNLVNAADLSHRGLCIMAENCHQLRSLHMRTSSVDDDSLQAVGSSCHNLHSLRLVPALHSDKPGPYTDEGVRQIASNCHHLQDLHIQHSLISDLALKHVAEGCPQLRKLNLLGCPHISDLGILDVARGCVHLQQLSLDSYDITDRGMDGVSTLSELTILKLHWCGNITDRGLQLVLERCCDLRSLDITHMIKITDTSMEFVAEYARELQFLCVHHCMHVTSVGIRKIVHSRSGLDPRIKLIFVQDCGSDLDLQMFFWNQSGVLTECSQIDDLLETIKSTRFDYS